MRCPQILWISLCKLAELLRYVIAGKAIVSVGDIFEHVQDAHPQWIDCYLPLFSPCISCTIPSTMRMSLADNFDSLSRKGASQ